MARTEALLQEVLKLSLRDRADVATELLASLDDAPSEDPAVVEKAWGAEIERRARRALAGESAAIPWDEVKRNLRDRLTQR
jgi:putative addiction module component (TIGR02574 family)